MKLIIRTLMTSLLGLTVLVTSTQVMAKPKKASHTSLECSGLYIGKTFKTKHGLFGVIWYWTVTGVDLQNGNVSLVAKTYDYDAQSDSGEFTCKGLKEYMQRNAVH